MFTKSKSAFLASALLALSLCSATASMAQQVIDPVPPHEVPFLCAESGDGSSAKFVNKNGGMALAVHIAERADRGGAEIASIAGAPAKTVNITAQGITSDLVVLATYHFAFGATTAALKPSSITVASGTNGTFFLLGYKLNAPQGSVLDSLYVVDNYDKTTLAKGTCFIENVTVSGINASMMSLASAQCVDLPPPGSIRY